ncbi:RmlC-like cupins superfamily protein [Perilla frutescens var. hirtella]|nr:RmlC-like cupins superfamily protein [Perilla frutescens var. hirtella]
MAIRLLLTITSILALASSLAYASDPSPLQDFCVAVNDSRASVFVNGKICKDPKTVTADDFFFSGLNKPGNTSNPNPPHTHPRATEILVVVEGTLYVGFVTSNPANPNEKNKLFTKTLYPGDVFVFPEGLIHFQFNTGKTNAVAFAGLSSQNPGVITIANAVFGSNPPISVDVLTRAFQVDANVVKYLQGQFWMNNN